MFWPQAHIEPSDLSASVVEPPAETLIQLVSVPIWRRVGWTMTLVPSPIACQPSGVQSPQVQREPSDARMTPWQSPIETAGVRGPVGSFEWERRRVIDWKTERRHERDNDDRDGGGQPAFSARCHSPICAVELIDRGEGRQNGTGAGAFLLSSLSDSLSA